MRGASGKPVKHHRTYELSLWDGRVLRTRISRPVDRTTYGSSVWRHILKQQLEVTSKEFWDCVMHKVLPSRGAPKTPEAPKQAVPLYMYRELIKFGVEDNVIRNLDATAAAELIAKKYRDHSAGDS